jgi:hypothetical protein
MNNVLRLIVGATLAAVCVWSQTTTASLEVIVKDSSGALVAGACPS